MDNDFMTAEEMYNQAKQNEKVTFLESWNKAKLTIRDALAYAASKGRYEADVFSIRICEEAKRCFVDFIVDKLKEAGYEVTTRESGPFTKIHVSCERRKG